MWLQCRRGRGHAGMTMERAGDAALSSPPAAASANEGFVRDGPGRAQYSRGEKYAHRLSHARAHAHLSAGPASFALAIWIFALLANGLLCGREVTRVRERVCVCVHAWHLLMQTRADMTFWDSGVQIFESGLLCCRGPRSAVVCACVRTSER